MDKPTPPAPFTYVKRAATELPLVFLSEAIDYGNAMAAWGAAQKRKALLDCRTCQNYTTRSGGCMSTAQCIDGSQYRASAPARYWAQQGD